MKLKITDEKLDELGNKYFSDEFTSHTLTDEKTFFDGFRAAEQLHQVKVDKLIQIVELFKKVAERINYDKECESDCGSCDNNELLFIDLKNTLEEADGKMKELKGVLK